MSHRRARVKYVDTTTTPLTLHPFTLDDAERMLAGEVDPHDGWEGGYAFTDEPELLSASTCARCRRTATRRPSAPTSCAAAHDGAAIGGVNLFGPPDDDGVVEFVFGLVPAVRGQGLSQHAVLEAVELARVAGATTARADAEISNLPARRALENAGFAEVSRTGDSITYEIRL